MKKIMNKKWYYKEDINNNDNQEDGKAKGISSGKREIESDIIISNMDIFHTYEKLLPNYKTPKKVKNNERSSSALVFYWGIKKSFPELDLHNIFFSSDYSCSSNPLRCCSSLGSWVLSTRLRNATYLD